MKGEIQGQEVIVMIDSGATNNFISLTKVIHLNVQFSNMERFGVTLGNKEKVWRKGECKNVKVEIQVVQILEDFLILELGSIDLILGFHWLVKLGEIVNN